MKLVQSRKSSDCAVAAFATVMNISYNKAMKLLHPERNLWSGKIAGTTIKQIELAYQKMGYQIGLYTGDFTQLTCRAIIVIKSPDDKHHALVWNPLTKRIMDPSFLSYTTIEFCKENLATIIIVD